VSDKKEKDGKDAKPKATAKPKKEAPAVKAAPRKKPADGADAAAAGAAAPRRPAAPGVKPRFETFYSGTVKPALVEKFKYGSTMQAPRLEKIVVNMGVGDAMQDAKLIDAAMNELAQITGQRPSVRRARKAISNFKLRAGAPVGCCVTLRGARMYEFYDRLVTIAVPRIRDFRGVSPRSFDGRGNYTLGLQEQIIFPEIDYDKVGRVRGMDVTIVTSAKSDEEGRELLRLMKMPFRQR
jgi:large subunit ribosomal protein L5